MLSLQLILPSPALAQGTGSPGNNAVYDNQGNCCTGSSAFVDARRWAPQGTDFCDTIHGIISNQNYPANGTVIDARGLNAGNATMVCAASPWGTGANKPSTILLPAGTITIPSKWVLPGGTVLIGEGTSTVSNTNGLEWTTIQACKQGITGCTTDFTSNTPMLQFGSSAGVKGISVEQLTLNGNNLGINGIENANSQDETYVDHVSLFQILRIGLNLHDNAQNSGPYTNITYDTNGASASTAVCVQIKSVNGATRSIQGLTCRSANYSPTAILLDSSNNLIRDVRIMGFNDGVLVGSQANAQSNVLMNILGDTDRISAPPINVVHIASSASTVTDLTIVGVGNQGTGSNTITDDRTSLAAPLADRYVAIYAVGRSPGAGMYSRFTTSPHAANWGSGAGAPGNPCPTGSLFSRTDTGALYVCDRTAAWHVVPLH
jgi:hypothetical protein